MNEDTNDNLEQLIDQEHNQEYNENESIVKSTGNNSNGTNINKKWLIIGIIGGVVLIGIIIYLSLNKNKVGTTTPVPSSQGKGRRITRKIYFINEGGSNNPSPTPTTPPSTVVPIPPTVVPPPTNGTHTGTTSTTTQTQQKVISLQNFVSTQGKKLGYTPVAIKKAQQFAQGDTQVASGQTTKVNIPTYAQAYHGLTQQQKDQEQVLVNQEFRKSQGQPVLTTTPTTPIGKYTGPMESASNTSAQNMAALAAYRAWLNS